MHSVFQCLALLLIGTSAAETDFSIAIDTGTPKFTVLGVQGDDVGYFYGIPFSKPRVPPFRFALPEEYVHEEGEIYNATVQRRDGCVSTDALNRGSEDCLYLDIYMPLETLTTPKPVLVWIHGGAWMHGSKNQYSLKLYAKHEWVAGAGKAVGVAVNYRLNILGFPDLKGVPLNLGNYDNMAALEWVQKHISNFGGDKDRVTIFGESCGGMQVLQLWASPRAQHLFSGGISQSPYTWSYEAGRATPYKTRAMKQEKMAACMLRATQIACAALAGGVDDPECNFQTPTTADLLNASCFGNWYGPVADDGATISNHFHQDICMQNMGGKPLLVGHTSLEMNTWVLSGSQTKKKNQMLDWIKYLGGPEVNNTCFYNELGHEYEASNLTQDSVIHPYLQFLSSNPAPDTPEEKRDIYATSGVFFNMISINLKKMPNVYMFVFDEGVQHQIWNACSNPHGAHACELPFIIGQPLVYNVNSELGQQNMVGGNNLSAAIQATMRRVWGGFAAYGTPGWGTNEIGVFTDGGRLETRAAMFSPKINSMLEQVMCHPETISEPCGSGSAAKTYECGEIKELYRDNGCCGKPTKTFEFPVRRLSAVPAIAESNEPSRILRSIDLALEDAKIKGGATQAHRLANLIVERCWQISRLQRP